MKRKKLVIISHTAHYKNDANQIVGWGATVNEINFLSDYWDEIVHIGCLHQENPPLSSLPYCKPNIRFVPIPPFGGRHMVSKFLIITKIPKIIKEVRRNIQDATEVQLRLPTSIGLFLLPYFSFYGNRKFSFWVKYAGNWKQKNPPWSYQIQRWWLKRNIAQCPVTINGHWPNQPAHCHSFENPCLTDEQITLGKRIRLEKQFEPPFVFAFVGRLEEAKGVSTLIEALQHIPLNYIKDIHLVGDGVGLENYKISAQFLGEKIQFHGSLASEKVHALLKDVHFFLLPSKSEGFPKVIAEAACYGAIPVVSKVGSIDQYINNDNGFLWDTESVYSYSEVLKTAVYSNPDSLTHKSEALIRVASKFTFLQYYKKLEKILFEK